MKHSKMNHIWFWSTFFAIVTFAAGYFQVTQSVILETSQVHKPKIRSQAFYPNGRYGRSDPELEGDVNENAIEDARLHPLRNLAGGKLGSLLCSYIGIGDLFSCVPSPGNLPPRRSIQSLASLPPPMV